MQGWQIFALSSDMCLEWGSVSDLGWSCRRENERGLGKTRPLLGGSRDSGLKVTAVAGVDAADGVAGPRVDEDGNGA